MYALSSIDSCGCGCCGFPAVNRAFLSFRSDRASPGAKLGRSRSTGSAAPANWIAKIKLVTVKPQTNWIMFIPANIIRRRVRDQLETQKQTAAKINELLGNKRLSRR